MRIPMTEYLEIDLDTERWRAAAAATTWPPRVAITRPGRSYMTATLARSTGR